MTGDVDFMPYCNHSIVAMSQSSNMPWPNSVNDYVYVFIDVSATYPYLSFRKILNI